MTVRYLAGIVLVLAVAMFGGTAPAQTTTITGTAAGPGGTDDNWNNAANWSGNTVPSGAVSAVVAAGLLAQVDNAATPTYTGSLTLLANSTLRIAGAVGSENAVKTVSGITMNAGSKIQVNVNANINYAPITLSGNASFESLFGASDWQTDNYAAITGPHTLTISGFNGHNYNLNAANTFSGLISNAIDRYSIYAKAAGSLGTGNVTVNPRTDGRSASLYIDAANAMADTATLYLNGTPGQGGFSGTGSDYLVMNADDTIAGLWVYGVQMPPGAYTAADDFIKDGCTGTLTVTGGPLLTLRVDPVTGATSILGHSAQGIAINYYQITSAGDSLDSAHWSSLADQDFEGNGPANGTGNGWEEAGGAGKHALAEAFLLGSSTIGASRSVSLGSGYDAGVGAEDLVFTYRTDTGTIVEGLVEYVTSAVPGDANLDGVVDAADYIALKEGFGTASGARYRDGDFDLDGDVDWDDLAILQGSFGQGTGSIATVPEPAALSLLVLGSLAFVRRRGSRGG
jgi:hypothetical protein